jgi:hypothetical protein
LMALESLSSKAAIQSYPSIFCCCLEIESIWKVKLPDASRVGLRKLTRLVLLVPDVDWNRTQMTYFRVFFF